MTRIEVRLNLPAPRDTVLRELTDYGHAPVLHRRYVRAVRVLEDYGDVTVALWRLRVLGLWRTAVQKQTVLPPDRLRNETTDGFAKGTVENTFLRDAGDGTTLVVDTVEVRTSGGGWPLEKLVAWCTRRLVTRILNDHKLDLENRLKPAIKPQ
jgi:hypothetical protein